MSTRKRCNNAYPFFVNTPVVQGFYQAGYLNSCNWANTYVGYYARYLLLKVMSEFDFTFPEEWEFGLDDYFLYNLFIAGNIPVFWDKKYGFVAQWGAYSGVNIALRPEYVTFQNNFFNGAKRKIGVDCVVFSLTADYCGIWDKVIAYADLLAEMHIAIKVNIINSKNPMVFGVPDKKIADNMMKMFDTIQDGEPAIYQKTTGGEWECFNPQAKSNYITPDMLIDMRKIVNMFCTDFGIPNANTDKRERLTDDEVNANNAETDCFLDSVLKRLKKCCDQVERLFGTRHIDVELCEALRRVQDEGSNYLMGNGQVPAYNPERT